MTAPATPHRSQAVSTGRVSCETAPNHCLTPSSEGQKQTIQIVQQEGVAFPAFSHVLHIVIYRGMVTALG